MKELKKNRLPVMIIAVMLAIVMMLGGCKGGENPEENTKENTDVVELSDFKAAEKALEDTFTGSDSYTLELENATVKIAWGSDLYSSDIEIAVPESAMKLMFHDGRLVVMDTAANKAKYGVNVRELMGGVAEGSLTDLLGFVRMNVGAIAEDESDAALFNQLLDFADALAVNVGKVAEKLPSLVKDKKLDVRGFGAALDGVITAEDRKPLAEAVKGMVDSLTEMINSDGDAIELPDLSSLVMSFGDLEKLLSASEKAIEGMDESAFKIEKTENAGVITYRETFTTEAFLNAMTDALKSDETLGADLGKLFGDIGALLKQLSDSGVDVTEDLPESIPSEIPETFTVVSTVEDGKLSSITFNAGDGDLTTVRVSGVNATAPDMSAFDGIYNELDENGMVTSDLTELLMVVMSSAEEEE
ncbi:MAG: hypothetical protein IK104_04890 [Clostridia bacterium]|nr:hypothetical protein [Clostridia bacterium]